MCDQEEGRKGEENVNLSISDFKPNFPSFITHTHKRVHALDFLK